MRTSDPVNLMDKVRELLRENLELRARVLELEQRLTMLTKAWVEEITAEENHTGKILRPTVRVEALEEDPDPTPRQGK